MVLSATKMGKSTVRGKGLSSVIIVVITTVRVTASNMRDRENKKQDIEDHRWDLARTMEDKVFRELENRTTIRKKKTCSGVL